MSEWRKIRANGLPNEDRSPKSGHRMAADGMPFPWRWNGGTNSTVLDGIWGMSVQTPPTGICRTETMADESGIVSVARCSGPFLDRQFAGVVILRLRQ